MTQADRDSERASKVDAILIEASSFAIATTRRQARKVLQGRGHLLTQLQQARRAKAEAEAR